MIPKIKSWQELFESLNRATYSLYDRIGIFDLFQLVSLDECTKECIFEFRTCSKIMKKSMTLDSFNISLSLLQISMILDMFRDVEEIIISG